jgi:hypothetical protein
MRDDPVMVWLRDARNAVVKQGDLEATSIARVGILISGEVPFGVVLLPPFASTKEFASWLAASVLDLLPASLRDEAVLLVERRWEVEGLPGWELRDALGHAYGVLDNLVNDAHERCGAEMERFAETPSGPIPVQTEHLAGRLPCMVATRETRSIRMNLRTGEVYCTNVVPTAHPTEEQLAASAGAMDLHHHRRRHQGTRLTWRSTLGIRPSRCSCVMGP